MRLPASPLKDFVPQMTPFILAEMQISDEMSSRMVQASWTA